MKSKRTILARTGAIVAFGAIVLTVAGCHHKAAEDYLAEGDADMQATKLSDAETAYQEAVKLAPNDPRTHIALGNLYIFEHKESDAQVEFMKVLELDPKNAATHVALGNLYNEQNQHGLAENQYRAAVALEPDRANYHLDLGSAQAGRQAHRGGRSDSHGNRTQPQGCQGPPGAGESARNGAGARGRSQRRVRRGARTRSQADACAHDACRQ